MDDEYFMRCAIEQAKKAYVIDEVPIGAVVVKDGEIVGAGFNKRDELMAIDEACKNLGGWRLWQCDLYVTLEPCPMCAGAIINSRIKRLVYGSYDYKAGSCKSVINLFDLPYNHKPAVLGGVLESECAELLSNFFKELRQKRKGRYN